MVRNIYRVSKIPDITSILVTKADDKSIFLKCFEQSTYASKLIVMLLIIAYVIKIIWWI